MAPDRWTEECSSNFGPTRGRGKGDNDAVQHNAGYSKQDRAGDAVL